MQSEDRLYGQDINLWPMAVAVLVSGIISAVLSYGFGRLLKIQAAILKRYRPA
ncbi:hypothetical protein [Planobispora takensis]|uniref:Uncharacterized protein n=1 Tax=Planobispora takensis TaxID=1367882 RepID=A0A8J3T5X5_9ACTN|nr:hypothetical protein [Planobispora takensis]GII05011.1 hypothetical protein Pta02_70190 [Planobispora takensis]